MRDWNEFLLGDLLQFQRGFDITTKEQQPGDIPVVSSSGITSFHNKAMVKGPGVVTGRKGSLGKVHFIQSDYWPHDTTLWIKDFKGNNPKFLYYLLQQIHLENYDVEASNPTLNRNHLHKLRLKCPPPTAQRKIAAILSSYDDLIENNNKRIALLEKSAEEIYREWFVRMRFPGWQQVKFEKGVPEGWGTLPLRDVALFNARSLGKDYRFDFINYVDISSVTTHRINNYEEIPLSIAPGRARRIVKHGDIIWSTVRPANRAFSLIFNPLDNLIVSTGFAVITPKANMPYRKEKILCSAGHG